MEWWKHLSQLWLYFSGVASSEDFVTTYVHVKWIDQPAATLWPTTVAYTISLDPFIVSWSPVSVYTLIYRQWHTKRAASTMYLYKYNHFTVISFTLRNPVQLLTGAPFSLQFYLQFWISHICVAHLQSWILSLYGLHVSARVCSASPRIYHLQCWWHDITLWRSWWRSWLWSKSTL